MRYKVITPNEGILYVSGAPLNTFTVNNAEFAVKDTRFRVIKQGYYSKKYNMFVIEEGNLITDFEGKILECKAKIKRSYDTTQLQSR